MLEGLIPAVVQDYYTGHVLMLAYVNNESYEYMLKYGETCFWSRSRNELWHKGATSGNVQKIKGMSFDCDKDALLLLVEQAGGGACHTGQYSCFGETRSAFDILRKIYTKIENRKASPKEKSYTSYLLNEGVDKICKKIGEEAAETIIAAKNGDKPELIGEISDLAYHVLVLMHALNINPSDIGDKLVERYGVEGNLKK
jgi:phosphoribosyl-ATP pyrophosphohydrolase/phosphoribosyl-AMP cyclohydrolase